jgi:nucleoside-diphosphate-sugar epimerase
VARALCPGQPATPDNAVKFTVIGAGGYVGSELVRHLRASGAEVATPAKGKLPDGPLGRVIYAAGATRDFLANPRYTLRAHATDFTALLDRDFDHCWYLSSVRLYDFTALPVVDESSPVAVRTEDPRSVFDATKLAGEAIGLHDSGGRVSVARLACVHGGSSPTQAFLHELIEMARRGITESNSHPEIQRDYIHIEEVCRALAAPPPAARVINFSSGMNVSNAELFQAIFEASGHEFTHKGPLIGYQPPPRIDNRRFVESFGFCSLPLLERIGPMFHPRDL